MRAAALAAVGVLLAVVSCTALVGDGNYVVADGGGGDAGPGADTGPGTPDASMPDTASGCGDTSSDPHNCGQCGHDCQGGMCSNGTCTPFVLVSGQASPWSIAIDTAFIYWTTRGTGTYSTAAGGGSIGDVRKAPLTGGATTLLASNQCFGGGEPLVVHGGDVYWINRNHTGPNYDGVIVRCAGGSCGGTPSVVVQDILSPSGLAADGSNVYWTDMNGNAGNVRSCSINCSTSSPPTLLFTAAQTQPVAIVVDSSNVYWTNAGSGSNGQVLECAIGGCAMTPTPLVSSELIPGPLAKDSANLYWVDGFASTAGTIKKCAIAGCGGSAATLAQGGPFPTALAVDQQNVFWTTPGAAAGAGSVLACGIGGCAQSPAVIASQQNSPAGIAVDATSVYWAENQPGRIWKWVK